jgi:hypothetical protein
MSDERPLICMKTKSEKSRAFHGSKVLVLAGTFALAASMSSAQIPRPAAPTTSVPCSPSPLPRLPDAAAGSAAQDSAQSKENLSDRLARADGVICPPADVDPEMKAPTPDAGKTPVIPPPGSPGGDPNIRPK